MLTFTLIVASLLALAHLVLMLWSKTYYMWVWEKRYQAAYNSYTKAYERCRHQSTFWARRRLDNQHARLWRLNLEKLS